MCLYILDPLNLGPFELKWALLLWNHALYNCNVYLTLKTTQNKQSSVQMDICILKRIQIKPFSTQNEPLHPQ